MKKWLYGICGLSMGAGGGFFVGFIVSLGRTSGTLRATLIFAIIGAVIGFVVGCRSDEADERNRTHGADDRAYWSRLNPKYAESIRCKYCRHFEPGVNRCHLYYNFDQSVNRGGPYFQEASPNGRCSQFMLTAMDVIAQSTTKTRPDGTYIVNLDDVM